MNITVTQDHGPKPLTRELWHFDVAAGHGSTRLRVCLSSYEIQKRETLRHKFKATQRYSRISIRGYNSEGARSMKLAEVPFNAWVVDQARQIVRNCTDVVKE